MPTFDLISIVWSKPYIDFFLNYVIPTYLSPGNLPKASQNRNIRFFIYCKKEELFEIQTHPILKEIQNLEFCPILEAFTTHAYEGNPKYGMKGYAQGVALKRAMKEKTIALLYNPDSLIADGTLTRTCELIEEGHLCVLAGELARIEMEKISEKLPKGEKVLHFTNQELVDLGLSNLHAIGELFIWNQRPFSDWNSILYWPVGKRSVLAKYFHLHPLAIDMRAIDMDLPGVLMPDDGGLIEFLKIDRKKIYVVEDSNELVAIEVSQKNLPFRSSYPKSHTLKVASWARKYTQNEDRLYFLNQTLRFQGTERIDWKMEEKKLKKKHFTLFLLIKMLVFLGLLKKGAIFLGARRIKRFLYKKFI